MRNLTLITLLVLLSSCSTIIKGSSDTVSISSLEKGTTIYVDGQPRGKNYVRAELARGESHDIRASKTGCDDIVMSTGESFDPVTLLGVFFDFGIFTVTTDLVTGSAWKASSNSYTVSPIC